jgi:transcription antitermination factor NusG
MRNVLDNSENAQISAHITVLPTGFVGQAQPPSNPETEPLIKPGRGGYRPGAGRKPRVEPMPDDTERWYCIRTFIGQDLTADIATRVAGYQVFAPTVWKPPTITTRDRNGIVRPALPARIVPLFLCYFFTKFRRADARWTEILHLPGVRNILSSTPGHPIAVPDHVIDAIRLPLHPNGCDYRLQSPVRAAPIAKDARVRVMSGPMADAMADALVGICHMSDGKRVKVLLQIMGRAVSVNMAQSAVEVMPDA